MKITHKATNSTVLSIRSRLELQARNILIISMSVFIVTQTIFELADHNRRIGQIDESYKNSLISKGRLLAGNNSIAVRKMAADNAVADMSVLLSTTVDNDPDIAWGMFLDKDRVPLVIARAGHIQENPSAQPLTDSASIWAGSIQTIDFRRSEQNGLSFFEFAAPVILDNNRLGTIRYALTTNSIPDAIAAMKKQALINGLLQTLIFLVIGALVFLFALRLAHRQSIAITKPLKDLTDVVNAIAGGDYSVALHTVSDDEIGVLARNFEAMRKTVHKYMTGLESIVSKRTAQLEEKNRELLEFARIASHDLQEPLRKISVFGGQIKAKLTDSTDPQIVDYLGRMISAVGRMQSLIDGLLQYSRVTTKASPFKQVDLGTIAREVVNDLEIRISSSGGKVEIGEMLTLHADELQMRQLMQNLIGNGLKYHKPDVPPIVRIGSKVITSTGRGGVSESFAEITVEDNGIGIAQEHYDKIFVVFQRLHSRTSEYEGSGIGLSVVKRIIERHHGSIRVESKIGEWTRFIVLLPLRPKMNQITESE